MNRGNSVDGKFRLPKIWAFLLIIALAGTLVFAIVFRGKTPEKKTEAAQKMGGAAETSVETPRKTIAGSGATIVVLPGSALSGGVSYGRGSVPTLTVGDGEHLAKQCPTVACVAPVVQTTAKLIYGRTDWRTQSVVGSTPNYLKVRDWTETAEGQVFSDRDVLDANKVCMVGATIKRELFNSESPVGKEMRIAGVVFRVVGVLSSKGANMMGRDQDDVVVAPWTAVKFVVNAVSNANSTQSQAQALQTNNLDRTYVDHLLVKAASTDQIRECIRQIKGILRERHHIKAANEDDDTHDDFNFREVTEITRATTSAADAAK